MFLKNYVYQPIAGQHGGLVRKAMGSLVTFLFIYLWHGTSDHVMLWSLFNYLAVILELLASTIARHPIYSDLEDKFFSDAGKRRLHAMLAAPLYVGSVLANFYFFMGADVGHYFVSRIFNSWPIQTLLIMIFAYMGNQVSIEIKNWELRKEIQYQTKPSNKQ